MDIYKLFLRRHFYISLVFLLMGALFGFFYSVNLLGFAIDSQILQPQNVRSVHISLMLYGFIPIMLSFLPFMLINKDVGLDTKTYGYLDIYAYIWYFFLCVMLFSLLMGVRRDLAFYDFHYALNFILAFAGLFYIIALYRSVRCYNKKPLWIKVSLYVIVIAPVALLFLMNPVVGQVEATINGPHGDNTLGMSFALIPLYYLIIKYLSQSEFKARWHLFWVIPLVFYIISVLHRIFIGELSYIEEWFFQWLTLLYVPLLYRWYKDADIQGTAKLFLLISIIAFLVVDIEGNILFIESIRWKFHRNDLVVAHAHIALGVAVLFMVFALYNEWVEQLRQKVFAILYLFGMGLIFMVLTIAGLSEAGYINISINMMWLIRTLSALFVIGAIVRLFPRLNFRAFSQLEFYNFAGFVSDGIGGLVLILGAEFLYRLFGFEFAGKYEYVVFGFVTTTGLLHLFALLSTVKQVKYSITMITAVIRVWISAIFLALYLASKIGIEALLIAGFDLCFALLFFLFFYRPFNQEQK